MKFTRSTLPYNQQTHSATKWKYGKMAPKKGEKTRGISSKDSSPHQLSLVAGIRNQEQDMLWWTHINALFLPFNMTCWNSLFCKSDELTISLKWDNIFPTLSFFPATPFFTYLKAKGNEKNCFFKIVSLSKLSTAFYCFWIAALPLICAPPSFWLAAMICS